MTAVVSTIASERWLDEVLLTGTAAADAGGADVSDTIALPAGLGDVAIMELMIDASPAATIVADAVLQNLGVRAAVISGDGSTTVDIVGVHRFYRQAAARAGCYISPDPLVLWRQGELLALTFPELDTNVSPTMDIAYKVKCVRVRPQIVSEQPQPLRLVR